MSCADRLREVELFTDLDQHQLDWLAEVGKPLQLADGEVLFEDGEPADRFFVLLAGELLITKVVEGREEVFGRHTSAASLATLPPDSDDKPSAAHQFTGELPLLVGGGYLAKAAAVGDTELFVYDRDTFFEMLARCPQVCRILLPVIAWRIHSYEARAGRRSMLEGLGTLAAGLAHELNNPTAALLRSASELQRAVRGLSGWAACWGETAVEDERKVLDALTERIGAGVGVHKPADALDSAELADEVDAWLADHDIAADPDFPVVLADHGVDPTVLNELADGVRAIALGPAVGRLCCALQLDALVTDITEAGRRIEALVRDTKAYSNLDRAPEQDVNVVDGIEATLAMQAAKLRCVRIRRDYVDLPLVRGYPSELNQVWTNLIENAVDAMGGDGELRLCTRLEADCVVVQIADNGPGIPPDVLPWLFQPFFTTKDIGKGTGLGLHLSRDVITHRHKGTIDVCSVPGDTRFIVRLPLAGATLSQS